MPALPSIAGIGYFDEPLHGQQEENGGRPRHGRQEASFREGEPAIFEQLARGAEAPLLQRRFPTGKVRSTDLRHSQNAVSILAGTRLWGAGSAPVLPQLCLGGRNTAARAGPCMGATIAITGRIESRPVHARARR